LAIAERTVKAHVTGAMNKLGAFTRAQAVALATQQGLL
jgi:DNA-binding CsgD family transcriptional regulator